MPRRCAFGCTPTRGVLHVFPNPIKFPEQFKAWVKVLTGETECNFDYKSKRVCDRHFVEKDRNRNNRLNALAVPTLFLPGKVVGGQALYASTSTTSEMPLAQHQETNVACLKQDTKSQMPSAQCQEATIACLKPGKVVGVQANVACLKQGSTSQMPSAQHQVAIVSTMKSGLKQRKPSAVTSNKLRIYQKNIKNLRRQVYRLRKSGRNFKSRLENAEKMYNMSDFQKVAKNMTTAAKIFCGMQYYQAKKKLTGRRFKIEEKVLSLSLYKRSPKCYGLMSKFFVLPSTKSLKRLLAQIDLKPGINNIVFQKLKKTITSLDTADCLCTIIFDEMFITPQVNYDSAKDELKGFSSHATNNIANHVLVFMVKGIKKTLSSQLRTISPTV